MCGIAGIVQFNGHKGETLSPLMGMLKEIKHRGPDDEGVLLADSDVHIFHTDDSDQFQSSRNYAPQAHVNTYGDEGKVRVALGHRRLSIIDITADGHQPMCDISGRYWMIFNGEIYNFKELKEELSAKGVTFVSDTDSEVLLYAFIHWGPECLSRFNGMWSFVIYDSKKQELFAARDRLGIKPFYYHHTGNQLVFCSEIKGIIASGQYKPEINYEGLWHNMAMGVSPRPMTCFEGVTSLKPGHYMTIDLKGQIQEAQYWEMPIGAEKNLDTEEKALNTLNELLNESVQYRLISDVKVGSFLSGGVDSGIVTALAAKYEPNIAAYTIGFGAEDDPLNEIGAARRVAERHAVEHITRVVSGDDLYRNIGNLVSCYEEPYISLAPPFLAAELAADQGAKVVLYGMGGDEFFGGYRYYNRIPIWNKLRKWSWLLGMIPGGLSGKMDRSKAVAGAKNIWEYYLIHHNNLSSRERSQLFIDQTYDTAQRYSELYQNSGFESTTQYDQISYIDAMSYLGSHQLHRNDQFSMHFSLEGRFPYLDHRIIEAAFRIPGPLKLKGGETKYLLKRAAEPYLPYDQIYQRKKGFSLPLDEWCRTSFKDLINDELSDLKGRNIFNNLAIDNIRKHPNSQKTWHLVMTEMWLKRFFK